MVASIIQIQCAFNFLMNEILICYCCSHIFELCYIFKGSIITYLYAMILPCIVVTRHQHILCFYLCLLQINILGSIVYSFFAFICGIYVTSQKIYISIDRSWCVLLNFIPTWFSQIFLMVYSKAKLENSGDKASPCFKPFWMQIFTYTYFMIGFF
jgi:hypothetical protein